MLGFQTTPQVTLSFVLPYIFSLSPSSFLSFHVWSCCSSLFLSIHNDLCYFPFWSLPTCPYSLPDYNLFTNGLIANHPIQTNTHPSCLSESEFPHSGWFFSLVPFTCKFHDLIFLNNRVIFHCVNIHAIFFFMSPFPQCSKMRAEDSNTLWDILPHLDLCSLTDAISLCLSYSMDTWVTGRHGERCLKTD